IGPLSLWERVREREKTSTLIGIGSIGSLSLWERERTCSLIDIGSIGPLSLWERVRERGDADQSRL
ncbi:hypothetical protein ACLBW2_21385, partial [Enterobacteriaceae bacterium C23F]